jgi:hypothetical protein
MCGSQTRQRANNFAVIDGDGNPEDGTTTAVCVQYTVEERKTGGLKQEQNKGGCTIRIWRSL